MSAVGSPSTIGIVGCYQNGKSTLVNCLLDDAVAGIGTGSAKSNLRTTYTWGEYQSAEVVRKDGIGSAIALAKLVNIQEEEVVGQGVEQARVVLWKPLLKDVDLVDTPGFDAKPRHTEIALASLENLQFVVLLLRNRALSEAEEAILVEIGKRKLPFCVVVNCFNEGGRTWAPNAHENKLRVQEIEDRLQNLGHRCERVLGMRVWSCNLAWFWYASQLSLEATAGSAPLAAEIEHVLAQTLHIDPTDHGRIVAASQFLPLRAYLQRIAAHWGHKNSPSGQEADALIARSCEALRRGDTLRAMLMAERACYKAPGYFPALKQAAEAYQKGGEPQEAIERLTRVLATDEQEVGALFARAKSFLEQGHCEEAQRDSQNLVSIYRELVESGASPEEIDRDKFRDIYLLKLEAEIRLQEFDQALCTLQEMIDSECVWSQTADALKAPLYAVLAILHLHRDPNAAEPALGPLIQAQKAYRSEKDDETFREICVRYETQRLNVPFFQGTNVISDLQSALWHCCQNKSVDAKEAVREFAQSNLLTPIYVSIWQDNPECILFYVSNNVDKIDDNWIASFLVYYFIYSQKDDLEEVKCHINFDRLTERNKACLKRVLMPKCRLELKAGLLDRGAKAHNIGIVPLSDLRVDISYERDNRIISEPVHFNKIMSREFDFNNQVLVGPLGNLKLLGIGHPIESPIAYAAVCKHGDVEIAHDAARMDYASLLHRGNYYLEREEYEKSEAHYSVAVKCWPEHVPALLKRAWCRALSQQYLKALDDASRAIELGPRNVEAYKCLAFVLDRQRRWREASQALSKALELNPDDVFALGYRGHAHLGLGHTENALADLTQAVQLNPKVDWWRFCDDVFALGYRGHAHLGLGHTENALADLTQAVELDPKVDWWRFWRALVLLRMGRTKEAQEDLEKAIALASKRTIAVSKNQRNTFNLALYHLAQGKYEKAKELTDNAIASGASKYRIQEALEKLEDTLLYIPKNAKASFLARALKAAVEK